MKKMFLCSMCLALSFFILHTASFAQEQALQNNVDGFKVVRTCLASDSGGYGYYGRTYVSVDFAKSSAIERCNKQSENPSSCKVISCDWDTRCSGSNCF